MLSLLPRILRASLRRVGERLVGGVLISALPALLPAAVRWYLNVTAGRGRREAPRGTRSPGPGTRYDVRKYLRSLGK